MIKGRVADLLLNTLTASVGPAVGEGLAADLMRAYGRDPKNPSQPDVAAAAKALGVPPRRIRSWLKAEQKPRRRVSKPRPLSGAAAASHAAKERLLARIESDAADAADGAVPFALEEQLYLAYGADPRDPSKPDVSAAAKALGVSRRRIRSWLATDIVESEPEEEEEEEEEGEEEDLTERKGPEKPRPRRAVRKPAPAKPAAPGTRALSGAAKKAHDAKQRAISRAKAAAKRAPTTRRARERTITEHRQKGTFAKGIRVLTHGIQGIDSEYVRDRYARFDLNPEQAEAFAMVYAEQGHEAAMQYLCENSFDLYAVGSWHFESLDSIEIQGLYGNPI